MNFMDYHECYPPAYKEAVNKEPFTTCNKINKSAGKHGDDERTNKEEQHVYS